MLINEFAQWSVLIFLGIFVLGLTRQLGTFLVPARDVRAREVGPDLGGALPSGLLLPQEHAEWSRMLEERDSRWGVVLVLSDTCPQCSALLEEMLADERGERTVPLVVVSRGSGTEHRARLEQVADLVVLDKARVESAQLTVAPFAFVVDRELRVHHKQFVADMTQLVAAANAATTLDGDIAAASAPAGGRPEVTHVNGDAP